MIATVVNVVLVLIGSFLGLAFKGKIKPGFIDSLGIAMIVAAAPVVDYKTTFGVNNLTILL